MHGSSYHKRAHNNCYNSAYNEHKKSPYTPDSNQQFS
jgi:hypothetical protein